MVKIIIAIYFLVILICFLEAYFCTKFDPESEKFLKEREKENDLHNR